VLRCFVSYPPACATIRGGLPASAGQLSSRPLGRPSCYPPLEAPPTTVTHAATKGYREGTHRTDGFRLNSWRCPMRYVVLVLLLPGAQSSLTVFAPAEGKA